MNKNAIKFRSNAYLTGASVLAACALLAACGGGQSALERNLIAFVFMAGCLQKRRFGRVCLSRMTPS